jgi:hypothetical protein
MPDTPISLFHYTTAAGLLGIVESETIWATDLRFLNDATELTYARDRFLDGLRTIDNPALDATHVHHDMAEDFGRAFDMYRETIERTVQDPSSPAYVTCFCEADDLLSQWRAYGASGGCSIEIDTAYIDYRITVDQDWYKDREFLREGLVQVRYGMDAARDLLDQVELQIRDDTNLGHPGTHGWVMGLRILRAFAQIKNPAFAEEREWRLVVTNDMSLTGPDGSARPWHPDEAMYRTTSVGITPYIAVPLPPAAIKGVRIGPGPHAETRALGVRKLLAQRHVPSEVQVTEAPLR